MYRHVHTDILDAVPLCAAQDITAIIFRTLTHLPSFAFSITVSLIQPRCPTFVAAHEDSAWSVAWSKNDNNDYIVTGSVDDSVKSWKL